MCLWGVLQKSARSGPIFFIGTVVILPLFSVSLCSSSSFGKQKSSPLTKYFSLTTGKSLDDLWVEEGKRTLLLLLLWFGPSVVGPQPLTRRLGHDKDKSSSDIRFVPGVFQVPLDPFYKVPVSRSKAVPPVLGKRHTDGGNNADATCASLLSRPKPRVST